MSTKSNAEQTAKTKKKKGLKPDAQVKTKLSSDELNKLAEKHAKAKGDKAGKTAVAKQLTKEKELKYIYPNGVNDLASRKKFRTDCRRKLAALEKAYRNIKKGRKEGDLQLAGKELTKFVQGNYVPEMHAEMLKVLTAKKKETVEAEN